MSTLIRVEEVEPVEVGLVLPDINKALRLILGLAFDVDLLAVKRFQMETTLPESYLIEPGKEDLIGIMPADIQAITSVSTHKDKKYVYISPDGWRTDFEYTLAAAVAIALAEFSGSEISDSALAYTGVFSQPAGRFVQAVKPEVEKLYYNAKEAAEAFTARLSRKRNAV